MVSIAHWLDTFTCSKYADRFERSGYQNLQSVGLCHRCHDLHQPIAIRRYVTSPLLNCNR